MFSDSLVTIMDVAVWLECKYFNYIIQLYNELVEFQLTKGVSTTLIDGLCVLLGFDMWRLKIVYTQNYVYTFPIYVVTNHLYFTSFHCQDA